MCRPARAIADYQPTLRTDFDVIPLQDTATVSPVYNCERMTARRTLLTFVVALFALVGCTQQHSAPATASANEAKTATAAEAPQSTSAAAPSAPAELAPQIDRKSTR